MRFTPVIIANDPLPAELILEADTACHRAGDMLMRASALSGSLRRAVSLGPAMLPELDALAEQGRLFTAEIERIRARLADFHDRSAS